MTDPIVPIIGGQRPETELQQRLREAQRNRVVFSLNQAMNRDPNKVAERVNLNLSTTVDDYIVAEEKRRRDVERITGRTAMSPATSEWLSNPDYSSISWDDADNLANVERGILASVGDVFTELAGGTLDTIFGAATAVLSLPERLIESYRTAGYSPPAFRKMLLEDLQRQGYTGRQLKRIEQQITPQTQEEWIQEGGILPAVSSVLKQAQEGLAAGQVVSQQLVTAMRTPLKDLLGRDGVDPASTRAAVYSGFRSLPAMLAVAPLYTVLGVHGAGAAFVVPLYGNAINKARAEGLDESSAHVYALYQAGLEYLTNIVPGGKFLVGMKLKSPLFQRIKDQLPAEIVQENIATATQDLLDMAMLEPEKTFGEYLAERPMAAWHTIVATTVGVGALNTAIRTAERLTSRVDREAQATESGGDMLSNLIDDVRQTETQKRSPRVAAHFQNLALETKGLESVRIESEVLSQILSESDEQAEFLQEFPEIAQQLNQNGTDPGTEVEMKTGDYVSLMALNDKYQDIAAKMQPNLRVGTAEFSLAEESAIEEERRAIREGLDEQMQDTIAREERNADQRKAILKELETFAAQMPNITPKKARTEAEIAVTAWESLAKANEMEVGELWELMKPAFVAGEITIPELSKRGALFQPEQIDAPYTAAVERGDMETAQRLVARAAGVPNVFDDKGIGSVPNNEEVDYKGFKLFLPAKDFLSVVPSKGRESDGPSFVEKQLRNGAKIGQPFLSVEWQDNSKSWKVVNHEGRSRSAAFSNVFGNAPMEVHVFAQGMRASQITEQMRAAPIVAQDSDFLLPHSAKFSAEAVTRDADGNIIPLSQRFDVTQPSILYAPDTGGEQRRGAYLPRTMEIILTEKATAGTLIHEFTHHYLHSLSLLARNENAPEAITSQFQTLLDWFGVADINAWDALPAEQKAVHHEAFTYSFEIFIGTGKAPTKKLETVFSKVAKWMRRIYGQIRSTLNAAYRKETKRLTGVERDLPALTPDVRQVFDTMMGAESEVAEAAADLPIIPIFRTQEESGMSDEAWEAYNQDAELYIDQATNELTARTARAQKWLDNATARVIRAKTKQAKQQRKAIRERIQAQVEQQPVYRAITMLRRGIYVDEQGNERKVDGQHRLNTKLVQDLFPKEEADPGYVDLSPLRAGRYGMLAKDGVDPAVVANQFGFATAADLVKALVAARPINDVINEQTDAEIAERHPELKPEAIKQAAMEALHNDALARFKATELKFLAGINKSVRVIIEAARREAANELLRVSYRNIKPAKFLAAERRAGKAAQRWMAKGDRQAYAEQSAALREARKNLREATELGDATSISQAEQAVQQAQLAVQEAQAQAAEQPGRATVDAVIRAKWNELYQGLLYREAIAARKRFTKHAKYIRRIAKQKDRGKKIGADHSEQIDHILRRLNIRGVSAKTAQQMQEERIKFQSWLEDQAKSGMEYPISDAVLNVASQRPIEDIPMDSLDNIVETIEQIYHAGNRTRNAFLMARNKRLNEIKDEIIANVVQYAGKVKPANVTPNTVLGRGKKALHTFFVQHIKTSTKAYVIDGGEYGAFWNTIIRTANRNQGEEQIEISDVTKKLEGIMEPFYAAGSMTKDSGAVMPRRVYNKETGEWNDDPNRAPRSLSREEVFVLALDLGNDSNIQRVVDGFGISEDEAKQIVSVLTTDELKAVQQIWDLFASFKPRVSEMERRLNGKEPTYLTPKPITLVSSDGTQVDLNGGYFPVKYDRSGSELGTSIEAATQAKMQLDGAFIGNQTRDSYKKTRVARVVNRPLLLQTSRMFSGLNEIIHDLHWREWLVDINLIMRPDGSVSRAIIENYGAEWMEDIRRWIKDIAAAGPGPMHPADQWLGLMRRFISISRLGFSPVAAAIQQTGNVVAVQHVGAKHVADATTKFLGDMRGAYSEMLDKSPEMRTRFQTRFRELGEVAARISGKKDWVMHVETGAYWMILKSQAVPDTITWHAAYSRAFEDNPGISDREAADRAFQAVLDTQGSGDLVNLSTIERGGPGSKLLTVFYTWQNTLFNEIYKIAKTEGLSAEGMTRLATLAAILPFLTVIIRDIVPDDEEELKKRRTGTGAMTLAEQYAWRTLEESINTLLGSVVGVRELASPIASILSGERPFEYRGPAGFAPIADLIAVFNAGAESGVISKRFGKRFVYFLGDLSGIPATQINRTWDGIDSVMSGDDVPWWAVVLGTQK